MRSREIIRALTSTGLSHGELAARTGVARETLSRWSTGTNRPSLEALQATATAAGYELTIALVPAEPKLIALVDEQLDLSPTARLRALLGDDWPGCRDALQAAALIDTAILVGPVAAALHGAPQRPGTGRVDILIATGEQHTDALLNAGAWPDGFEQAGDEQRERWTTHDGTLTIRRTTAEHLAALRHRAHTIAIDNEHAQLHAASAEDLLAISTHSPWSDDALYRSGLRAVLANRRYRARHPRTDQPQPT